MVSYGAWKSAWRGPPAESSAWWALAAVVLALALRIAYFLPSSLPLNHDGATYLGAARAVVAGSSPVGDVAAFVPPRGHAIPPYIYPPALAVALVPLALLPPGVADILWLATVSASCVLLAWLLSRWLGLLPAAVAVLGFVPTWDTAILGQVNAMIGCLTAVAIAGMSVGRDGLAGGALAAGAILKLGPAAGLVVLAVGRRWRAIAVGTAVVGVAVLVSLPAVSIGDWWAGATVAANQPTTSPTLASWPALLERLARIPATSASAALALVLMGATMARAPAISMEAALAAASLVPVLAPVVVWPHHAVMALPALAVAWSRHAGRAAGTVPVLAWLAVNFFTFSLAVVPLAVLSLWAVLLVPSTPPASGVPEAP